MSTTYSISDPTFLTNNLPTLTNPTAASATPVVSGTPGLTADQASAKAIIENYFSQFGLDSLGNAAWQQYLNGQPVSEILLNARNSPEYAARYPAMKDLQAKGQAWTEGQYQQYETSFTQALTAAGIPPDTGFYSPDYIGKFISGDVALPEVQKRIDDAASAAKVDAYSQAANKLYGVDQGHLTAMFLDPTTTQPLIDRKFGAIQAAGEATNAHFGGGLDTQEAEYLSQFGLSQDQLEKGFGDLAPLSSGAVTGEADQNGLDAQTQLDYVAGQNYAKQRVDQRRAQLAQQTQGTENFTSGKEGSGVGEAQQGF